MRHKPSEYKVCVQDAIAEVTFTVDLLKEIYRKSLNVEHN